MIGQLTKQKKSGKILDVGCGVGAVSQLIDQARYSYLGVDYSSSLIGLGTEYFGNQSVQFSAKNASELTESDGPIDMVFINGALHHMPDPNKVLEAIRQIATPDAIFVAIEPMGENPVIGLMRYIRGKVDPNYSDEQIFFKKRELYEMLSTHMSEVSLREFGYLTPPLAQVALPKVLAVAFFPLFALIDQVLFSINKYVPMRLTWNVVAFGKLKPC